MLLTYNWTKLSGDTFGGTAARIACPTAPAVVPMLVVLTQYASAPLEAFTIVMLAGWIQMALGALRIGRFITYTPYSMIAGFTSGIGVIAILIQVSIPVGSPTTGGSVFGVFSNLPEGASVNWRDLVAGMVSVTICVIWPDRLRRFVPASLVALLVTAGMAAFWLDQAHRIGELPTQFPTLHMPMIAPGFLIPAKQPALTLALIGSVNSLLTCLASDSLTRARHRPNSNGTGGSVRQSAVRSQAALLAERHHCDRQSTPGELQSHGPSPPVFLGQPMVKTARRDPQIGGCFAM